MSTPFNELTPGEKITSLYSMVVKLEKTVDNLEERIVALEDTPAPRCSCLCAGLDNQT